MKRYITDHRDQRTRRLYPLCAMYDEGNIHALYIVHYRNDWAATDRPLAHYQLTVPSFPF
jgi:hypothetical protein